jgi:hypothetical protein
MPNPLLRIPLHWLGGLASGSFYVPYRAVKGWSWETYWLVGGIVSWILLRNADAANFQVIHAQHSGGRIHRLGAYLNAQETL